MTIIVGYVPRPEGEAALALAVSEARRRQSRLLVINTSRGDAPMDTAYAGEAEMRALRDRLSASGVAFEVRQLVRGLEAAQEIVTAARELEAELIVIGLRRRTSVGKFILGSNAQEVLFDAPCPVLTVKADALPTGMV